MTVAEYNKEVGLADDRLCDAFAYLAELIAEKDPGYNVNYEATMERCGREVLETLTARFNQGQLI